MRLVVVSLFMTLSLKVYGLERIGKQYFSAPETNFIRTPLLKEPRTEDNLFLSSKVKELYKCLRTIRLLTSTAITDDNDSIYYDDDEDSRESVESKRGVDKRTPFAVDFMGMRVSYPIYLRLTALQKKVIELDKLIRNMRRVHKEEELKKNPKWNTLIMYHRALKKMLPVSYLRSIGEDYSIPLNP